MDTRDQLLGLIQALYAAPGDEASWHRFLGDLCGSLDGSQASFISHDLTARRPAIAVNVRTDPTALRDYLAHWGREDPWAYSAKSRGLTGGSVVSGDQLISRRDLAKTAFFNDFGREYDVTQCLAGTIEAGAHALSVVSINASDARAAFGPEDVALLRALMPHLQRALQLHRRIASAESALKTTREALDLTWHGILILDSAGRVVETNRTAALILNAADGLRVERHELRASSSALTDALRTLIGSAIGATQGAGLGSGGCLSVGRPSGRLPLQVVVGPVSSKAPSPFAPHAGAMVVVTDPELQPLPSEQQIMALLDLTAGEARLVRLLAEGLTVEGAAARLNLTTGTVRTRLKTIFGKTGTHRQAELVRLILRQPVGSPDHPTNPGGGAD